MVKGLQRGWRRDGVSLSLVQASVQYWTNQLTPFPLLVNWRLLFPAKQKWLTSLIFPIYFEVFFRSVL